MKQKQHNNISENQVEEAFVANLLYLQQVLGLETPVRLIARQMWLRDGERRIDLLLASGKTLHLVELKITRFEADYLEQVLDYQTELQILQQQELLIPGEIKTHLLVTEATRQHSQKCANRNVNLIVYEPLDVLQSYYRRLSAAAPFLKIKPNDYGVYNLSLMNRTLSFLAIGAKRENEIVKQSSIGRTSVQHHLRVSEEFGLVRERNKIYALTDLGDEYVQAMNQGALAVQLSERQIELLKRFIAQDPFYSSTVFGIYSIVESAFLLSRNLYPISLDDLRQMFRTVSGKSTEWRVTRSLNTATYTFLNFATDLELLGKIGKQIVITPAGFRFILMLQLHKSIEMIETLTTNEPLLSN